VRIPGRGNAKPPAAARLFAQPANVLVLDKRQRLDIESLRGAGADAAEYAGTLLLVSHDPSFLDNVVTQTPRREAAACGANTWAGYSDWLAQRARPRPRRKPAVSLPRARNGPREAQLQGKPRARSASRGIEAPGSGAARARGKKR